METTAPQLSKGDRVTVRNSTLAGEIIVEGIAVLDESDDFVVGGLESWSVRFEKHGGIETSTYTRWIDPADKL